MCGLEVIMNLNQNLKENEFMYDDLINDLRDGVCRVTFTKKDGTERKMKCTLNEKFMPKIEFAKDTKEVKEPNKEVVKCWDLEKEAWRSFRVDSVKIAFLEQYGDKV
jgi:hypothetical protein